MRKQFSLRYLPQFEEDLAEARNYIAYNLQNPTAALRLLEATEKAILERLENPLSFQPYPSARPRKHPYYRIYVNNFTVFYVVIEDVMEIRRFIYSRRSIDDLL